MNLLNKTSRAFVAALVALVAWATTPLAAQDTEQTETDGDKMSHLEIGNALWQAGKTDKAEEVFKSSIKTAANASQVVALSNRLADLYVATNRSQEAIKIYDGLLSQDEIRRDTATLMDIYDNMGRAYAGMRQYNKAMRCYKLAQSIMHAAPDTLFAMTLYNDMATALLVSGNLETARSLADSALKMAREEDWAMEAVCQKTSARILAKMRDYKGAYEHMDSSMMQTEKMWANKYDALRNGAGAMPAQTKAQDPRLNSYNNMELRSQVDEALTSKNLAQAALLACCLLVAITAIGFGLAIKKQRSTEEENRKLTARNEENEKIISIIGHDATNQFNTLIGFTSLQMEEAKGKDSNAYDALKQINMAALSLHDMMSNMTTWVMTKGNLKPTFRSVLIAPTVQKVLETCSLMTQSKGINVSYNVEPNISAMVDGSHLEVILRNLVNNAIKFTQRDGEVSISAITHGDRTSIVIEDTGIGMDEEVVQQFNANEQLKTYEGTEHEKGMGLGLSICREMVALNKGEMVISAIPERGTSVTIVFKKGTSNENG